MRKIIKRYSLPGTPPGTLAVDSLGSQTTTIRCVSYGADVYSEKVVTSVADEVPEPKKAATLWLHVQGAPSSTLLEQLGRRFDLHALALEDVQNTGQRPKFDAYDERYFIVVALPVITGGRVHTTQVSIFYGADFVVSIVNDDRDPFEPVRRRLRIANGPMQNSNAGYLLYALLDVVIDEGFPTLEALGERLDGLEDRVLAAPSQQLATDLHDIKRSLLILRRILWPQRDVINSLLRDETLPIDAHTRIYLRDCYDHSVQLIELIENYRDVATSIMDIYLSSINNRLNEVMRLLTVITTIFIPLTFIAGVYGMNFGNGNGDGSPLAMPELNWYYGYPFVLLLMAGIAGMMVVYFKRKGWF